MKITNRWGYYTAEAMKCGRVEVAENNDHTLIFNYGYKLKKFIVREVNHRTGEEVLMKTFSSHKKAWLYFREMIEVTGTQRVEHGLNPRHMIAVPRYAAN